MSNYALEIKNLCSTIGNFSLTDINITLEKGTIIGFIGKNGAGKTTLIKTILDILPRKSGSVLFFNRTMDGNEAALKSKIGVVFNDPIYSQNLKGKTILKTISPFYNNFDFDKFNDLIKKFHLDLNKKLKHYSKGMQMKFSIAMALSHNPDLIILDEPTSGLDPVARTEILGILYDIIQNEEKTILFSTHVTSDLDKIADYIVLIDNGKIIFNKAKDEMLDEYTIVRIDKETMTDDIRSNFICLKETAFGHEGLIADKSILSLIPNAKIARPTIEDIMVYINNLTTS